MTSIEIRQYRTPNLPASYYVEVDGVKVTETTMDRKAAEQWKESLERALAHPRPRIRERFFYVGREYNARRNA